MRRPSLKMEARLDELFVDIVVLALAAAAPEKLPELDMNHNYRHQMSATDFRKDTEEVLRKVK